MMYSQEDVFAKLTVAFSKCHPKFPWPKKHGLADQTEEFRLAIADVTAKVNEEVNNVAREAELEGRRIEKDYYQPEVKALRAEVAEKKSTISLLGWSLVLVGVIYIGTFLLMFGVCKQGPVGPMSGSSPIYCVK